MFKHILSLALALSVAAASDAPPSFDLPADALEALRSGRNLASPDIYKGVDAGPDIVARTVHLITCYDSTTTGCGSCTGAIIRRRWFLTAAHCVQRSTGQKGRAIYIYYKGSTYTAAKVHMYSTYTRSPLEDDIALVQINSRFPGTAAEVTYKLATKDAQNPTAGETVRIAGFGRTGPTGGISYTLQESSLARLSDSSCYSYPGRGFICTSSGLGLGESDVVQCSGDSGGPLFVDMPPDKNGNPRFRLVGINSATVGVGSDSFFCGSNNNLHVHAKVSTYAADVVACLKQDCSKFTVWAL